MNVFIFCIFFFFRPRWFFLAYLLYFYDDIFFSNSIYELEDDQEIEDIMIQHSYVYADEFAFYQFQRFQRILYDSSDLETLYILNVAKSNTSGFFFKRLKEKNLLNKFNK